MAQTFENIKLMGTRSERGTLTVDAEKFHWKANKGGREMTISASDVKEASWQQVGKAHRHLKFILSGGTTQIFGGFMDEGVSKCVHVCVCTSVLMLLFAARGSPAFSAHPE